MKFLMTLNMPSASGMLVHQIIVEGSITSMDGLCRLINSADFVTFKQWYRRKIGPGDVEWEDRGNLIVNTSHIGKIQEYIDYDAEETTDARRNSGSRQGTTDGSRGAVRGR